MKDVHLSTVSPHLPTVSPEHAVTQSSTCGPKKLSTADNMNEKIFLDGTFLFIFAARSVHSFWLMNQLLFSADLKCFK